MKERLCFVSQTIYPVLTGSTDIELVGGAEVQQSIIIRELDRRGYDISVITMDYGQERIVRTGNNIKIYRAAALSSGIRFLRQVHPIASSVWSLLRQVDADIYYQRCAATMLTGIVALFCRMHDKAFFFSASHDRSATMEQAGLHYNPVSMMRDRIFFNYALKNASVVISQNEFQKEMFLKNYRIRSIIIKSACREESIGPVRGRSILWVGRLLPWKRPEHFIEISKGFMNEDFVLVGGTHDEAYELKLKSLAEESRVRMEGFIPYASVGQYFDNAKVLVNTSHQEGFPNTFLQAWSRGIPVVSSVDPSDVIKRNQLGFYCRTLDEFRERIAFLLDNEKEYRRFSRNCFSYFRKNHTVERIVDEYERLIAAYGNKERLSYLAGAGGR